MITPLPQTMQVPTVILVHLIDTEPQIRMRNGFDDTSIGELASSIARHGLLQPIVVRPVGERFAVVAGHRRLRAVQRLQAASVNAVVLEQADDESTFEAQLAENIQRERLTLADTADALRTLSHIHEKPADLAKIVGKSKSWVSKNLALTKPSFPALAYSLMIDEVTEDLELLLMLAQIERIDKKEFARAVAKVRNDKLARQGVKAILERLKAPAFETDLPADVDTDAETDAAAYVGSTEVAFTLNATDAADFEELGGVKWVRAQLRAWRKSR